MMHLVNVCQILCETFGVFQILLFLVQWLTSIKNISVDVRLIICYCLPSVKLFELKKKEKKLNIVKVFFLKMFFFFFKCFEQRVYSLFHNHDRFHCILG